MLLLGSLVKMLNKIPLIFKAFVPMRRKGNQKGRVLMATLDLTPLNKEAIEKMGLHMNELWLVKIGQETFGPFESEALREYSSQNETLFDEAHASKVETNDFKPFWTHALFQRRSPQIIKNDSHDGPFWILDQGQKMGPVTSHDVEKKLEMGFLSMADHLSIDNGQTWKKIFEFAEFDRRTHSADELPMSPLESVFQQSKIDVMEKLENGPEKPTEELASLAHVILLKEKINHLKLEEVQFKQTKNTEVSPSLNWAIPTAAMILVALVSGGYYAFSPEDDAAIVADIPEDRINPKKVRPNPSLQLRKPQVPSARRPASIGPEAYAPRPTYSRPSFPTQMETHNDIRYDEPSDVDPRDLPAYGDAPAATEQEHSLVQNTAAPVTEDQSLDAVMNGEQPTEPVVDEASDF